MLKKNVILKIYSYVSVEVTKYITSPPIVRKIISKLGGLVFLFMHAPMIQKYNFD